MRMRRMIPMIIPAPKPPPSPVPPALTVVCPISGHSFREIPWRYKAIPVPEPNNGPGEAGPCPAEAAGVPTNRKQGPYARSAPKAAAAAGSKGSGELRRSEDRHGARPPGRDGGSASLCEERLKGVRRLPTGGDDHDDVTGRDGRPVAPPDLLRQTASWQRESRHELREASRRFVAPRRPRLVRGEERRTRAGRS